MAETPRVYKAEALILRRRNVGEADSVFTLLTERYGKFDAIARGVRKARSRMRGHLEPLSCAEVVLAHGRTFDVFTQAQTVRSHRGLRDDLARGAAAMYCAELVERMTAERQPNPQVYGLLLAILDGLEEGLAVEVVRWFELHLLGLAGFAPELDQCAACGEGLPADAEALALAPGAGGLVCRGCRAGSGPVRLLSVRAVKVLRFGRRVGIDEFAAVRCDDALARELAGALHELVRHVLEREPVTTGYVHAVASLPARPPHPATAGEEGGR